MKDILCVYYSRTGKTKKAMEEIAEALGAELVEIRDDAPRSGFAGWLYCGLDAVKRSSRPVLPYETKRPIAHYDLVILGSPVWAGRCSSVMRSFLKRNGRKITNAAYVLTRGSSNRSEDIFAQMDQYVDCGHCAAVSLHSGSVGYVFWKEEFLRQVREFLGSTHA